MPVCHSAVKRSLTLAAAMLPVNARLLRQIALTGLPNRVFSVNFQ
jgi:hypothetical protein